jgi:hypothetical protein
MTINECQSVECTNIGRNVRVQMQMEDGKLEEHNIFLCRICINLQNALNGGLNN